MRLESGARGVSGQCATGVSRARSGQFFCAEIFRHRNGDAHSARFEALGRIDGLVFDPKIDIDLAAELFRLQQRRSAFAQRDELAIFGQRQQFAITPERSLARRELFAIEHFSRRRKIDNREKRFAARDADVLQSLPIVLLAAGAAFEMGQKHTELPELLRKAYTEH